MTCETSVAARFLKGSPIGSATSWQSQMFAQLRDREWHRPADLFAAIEKQIPLHFAMRWLRRQTPLDVPDDALPSAASARWRFFHSVLTVIGVEREQAASRGTMARVRLRYVAGRRCGQCGGPVLRAGWLAKHRVACLRCERRAAASEPRSAELYRDIKQEARLTGELVRYDSMCRAITEAFAVDEVKDIRDKAAALEHYARQARNTEAERQCAEIRLRAERKAGQLIREGQKRGEIEQRGGNRKSNSDASSLIDAPRKLGDLGITHDQSSQWQRLANVPEPQFEADSAPASTSSASSKSVPAAASTSISTSSRGWATWNCARRHSARRGKPLKRTERRHSGAQKRHRIDREDAMSKLPDFIFGRTPEVEREGSFALAGTLVTDLPKLKRI